MGIYPDRIYTENLTSEFYNENLFLEDYARTISSENHNENPSSRTSDKIILFENYTNVDKKTGEKVQLTMTATPGVQLDELAKPYLRLEDLNSEAVRHLEQDQAARGRRFVRQSEALSTGRHMHVTSPQNA